jgi:nucleoside-diphosphate-sugar epimerase
MKILITGASGFLGKSLSEELSDKKIDFVSVYRRKEVVAEQCFLIDNIDSKTDWSSAFCDIDVVIHCAARVHVMNDTELEPLAVFREVNTAGTLNLAKQAAEAGVKRFIFISSIKVNGECTLLNNPFRANDDMAPQDPYGISKAEAEQGLIDIAKETGMEIVIIRPPLVYGPGVKANFAAMMKLASLGIPLPLGAVTNNRRSLVYVDNLVDLIITCISHPKAANQTFLVSDDDDLSTTRMIKELGTALGKKGWLLPIPVILFEILGKLTGKSAIIDRLCGSLQVDMSKTRELLDWQAPVCVKDAFAKTASHFMLNRKNK